MYSESNQIKNNNKQKFLIMKTATNFIKKQTVKLLNVLEEFGKGASYALRN